MTNTLFWLAVLSFLTVGWWLNIFMTTAMGSDVQSLIGFVRVIGIIIPPLGGVLGYL